MIVSTALLPVLIFGMMLNPAFTYVINDQYEPYDADVVSQTPEENKYRFAEDRVIVKLAGYQPSMFSNGPGNGADLSYLGVSFTDIRMLNPATAIDELEINNTGGFASNPATNTQNNVFVLTLGETGVYAVENALAILNENPYVEIAEPDYLREFAVTPNDPMFKSQYALAKINASAAWDVTTGDRNVVVGVVDSGIDGTHPDLAANLWVNPNAGKNGYVNDIHGYNFTGKIGGIPTDKNGHGTHVSGIIGAKGNNGAGISGVNWNVSLAWLGVDAGGNYVSDSAVIEAINYANNHGITILNGSWGGSAYSEALKDAISNYNGLFVAAVGNNSSNNDVNPFYPSSFDLPNIIAVASTDSADKLASTSNYGAKSVHIAAPGDEILSTYPNGKYKNMSGTSMASPHVAGVAALIKAAYPKYSTEHVRDKLIRTARSASTLTSYGFGIVDANAALKLIYGDVNNDGRVDMLDCMILRLWLAGWRDRDFNEAAADINGDGIVNSLDLMIMRLHLTAWPGYESLPVPQTKK